MATTKKSTQAEAPAVRTTLAATLEAVRVERERLRGLERKLNDQRADLIQKRDAAYLEPLTPAEVKAYLVEAIDFRAANYLRNMGKEDLIGKVSNPVRNSVGKRAPLCLYDVDEAFGNDIPNIADHHAVERFPEIFYTVERFGGWAYFYLGDLMKSRLEELLKAGASGVDVDFTDGAAKLAQRRETVAAIAAELARVEQEIATVAADLKALAVASSDDGEAALQQSEEEVERDFWARRLNIDPKREPEKFEYEMKREREYSRRLAEDASRPRSA